VSHHSSSSLTKSLPFTSTLFTMVFARSAINLARPAGSLFTQRVASRTATSQIGGVRTLTASSSRQGKVLLCLYDVSISCRSIHQILFQQNNSLTTFPPPRARSTPNRSPASSAPQRTSSESASGSRTKGTLSSPPPTRRARAVSLRRRWLTPKSSLPLRKFLPFFSTIALGKLQYHVALDLLHAPLKLPILEIGSRHTMAIKQY